jgi:hypothetical protein
MRAWRQHDQRTTGRRAELAGDRSTCCRSAVPRCRRSAGRTSRRGLLPVRRCWRAGEVVVAPLVLRPLEANHLIAEAAQLVLVEQYLPGDKSAHCHARHVSDGDRAVLLARGDERPGAQRAVRCSSNFFQCAGREILPCRRWAETSRSQTTALPDSCPSSSPCSCRSESTCPARRSQTCRPARPRCHRSSCR